MVVVVSAVEAPVLARVVVEVKAEVVAVVDTRVFMEWLVALVLERSLNPATVDVTVVGDRTLLGTVVSHSRKTSSLLLVTVFQS